MHIRFGLRQNRSEVGVEETLADYPALSRTTIGGWVAVGCGLGTLGVSGVIVLAVMGVISGTKSAPDWVLWCGAAVLAIGGVVLCMHGVSDLVRARRARLDAGAHPDEPWRLDYAWVGAGSARGMRSRESGWWVLWGLALLIVACLALVSVWFSGTGPGGVGGVFLWCMSGIVLFALVVYACVFVRRAAAALRYGPPRVVYETMPARPGEMLTGRVVCPRGFGALERVTLTLRWVEERYEKVPVSGGKDKTKITCRGTASDVWVIDDVAAALGADERSAQGELPIAFLIPQDAGSTRASERPARYWDLEVRGEARGVDFLHRFVVPVYGG